MRTLLGDLPEVQRLLHGERDGAGAAGGWARGSLAARLAALPEPERQPALLELVRTQAGAVLGHGSPDAVAPERAFRDLGFDSLAGVQLRNRLASESGLRLPATLVFDYPRRQSWPRICWRCCRAPWGRAGAGGRGGGPGRRADRDRRDRLRYPGPPGGRGGRARIHRVRRLGGAAVGARGAWRRGYRPVPRQPWLGPGGAVRPRPDRSGTCYVREGGFLYDAGEFDAAFFGVGPREALAMDPQQRLLLEVCWEAFEDGGSIRCLKGTSTGVFAGISIRDYAAGPLGAEARSRATWGRAAPAAWCPAGSRTRSGWRAPR